MHSVIMGFRKRAFKGDILPYLLKLYCEMEFPRAAYGSLFEVDIARVRCGRSSDAARSAHVKSRLRNQLPLHRYPLPRLVQLLLELNFDNWVNSSSAYA